MVSCAASPTDRSGNARRGLLLNKHLGSEVTTSLLSLHWEKEAYKREGWERRSVARQPGPGGGSAPWEGGRDSWWKISHLFHKVIQVMVAESTLLQERKRKRGREKEVAKWRKKFTVGYRWEKIALPLTHILKNSPKWLTLASKLGKSKLSFHGQNSLHIKAWGNLPKNLL